MTAATIPSGAAFVRPLAAPDGPSAVGTGPGPVPTVPLCACPVGGCACRGERVDAQALDRTPLNVWLFGEPGRRGRRFYERPTGPVDSLPDTFAVRWPMGGAA